MESKETKPGRVDRRVMAVEVKKEMDARKRIILISIIALLISMVNAFPQATLIICVPVLAYFFYDYHKITTYEKYLEDKYGL